MKYNGFDTESSFDLSEITPSFRARAMLSESHTDKMNMMEFDHTDALLARMASLRQLPRITVT